MKITMLSLFFFYLFLNQGTAQSLPDDIDISTSPIGVVALPSTVPAGYAADDFVKYTKIQCPNGEAIHIVAQSNITDAQIVKARQTLAFYLNNYPGSQYGDDKTNVINTMGTNDAQLVLLNGLDDGQHGTSMPGQWLFEEEMAVEGHTWYQNNQFDEHRDATLEEILHLVHDMGIGIDGTNSISNPALPDYQLEIRAATNNAVDNNFAIWPVGANSSTEIMDWYNEIGAENSHTQEYMASLVDSYYGLWDPWTEDNTTGMWGMYIAHNRDEVQTEDPMGWAVMQKYFSPYWDVDMIIDSSFTGTFTLTHDPNTAYTLKSRYLQHVFLYGTKSSSLQGNDLYNRLTGNAGDNSFEGLQGNDRLDGQAGTNTAIFTGPYTDYTVTNFSDYAIVTDGTSNRDGVDTLWNIHSMVFSDQTVAITLNATYASTLKSNDEIKLYPNPAKDLLTIQAIDDKSTLKLYNVTGQLILEQPLQKETRIDISDIPGGIYLAYIFGATSRNTYRLVKQ